MASVQYFSQKLCIFVLFQLKTWKSVLKRVRIHCIPHTILQFYVIKSIKIKSKDTEIKSIKTYKSNKSKQNYTNSIPYFLKKILAKTFFRKKSVAKYIISQVIKPLLVLATIRFIHFSEGHLAKTLPTHCTV